MTEPAALYGELFGTLPDGSYGNTEGGRRHAAGEELDALFARERARRNSHNIAVTFSDGLRIRPDRFVGDGSDATTDPETGDVLVDGFRAKNGP